MFDEIELLFRQGKSMIREQLIEKASSNNVSPTAFRWRGGDVSRLESFSDAVFGFALTLLVVSLEVPHTFDALLIAMRGFVGFAVCFVLLSLVWYDHYVYFRQYGLRDSATVVLNLCLLFVVMFYVFPLKFLFTLLASITTGMNSQSGGPVIQNSQVPTLMIIYGVGFMAIHIVFTLMYMNAWRQRDLLALNRLERFDTRASAGSHLMLSSIGLFSVSIAYFGGVRYSGVAGFSYFLIGLGMSVYWSICGGRRQRLEKAFTLGEDSL